MNKVIIIAEAGVNHNGSIENAKLLIDAAFNAGVDYVKFQTYIAENLVSQTATKAAYQKKNSIVEDETQFTMLKKLELTKGQHLELITYCKEKNIKFFSTAFDLESIDFLYTLNLGLWKIPSGEITNYPYLKKIADYKQPVIISTGMSNIEDVRSAVNLFMTNGLRKDDITILHCNTEYPTPMEDVNLKAMLTLKDEFGVRVGYSDHTLGVEVPIAAVALGASVIEKHFTLDRNMDGPDHKASLEPNELIEMVKSIRNIEKALGNGLKTVSQSEQKNIVVAHKSIVASTVIAKGELFTTSNLTVKRPGTGLSPMKWIDVLGKKAKKTFQPDDLIQL